MAVERTTVVRELSPEEKGIIADRIIDFALVPNRRVVLERTRELTYEIANLGGVFSRTLTVTHIRDGERRYLSAASEWKNDRVVSGLTQFSQNGHEGSGILFDEEAEKPGYDFLKELLNSRD